MYDSISEKNLDKRLTERRKGIFNSSKKSKPEQSKIYCHICNIPESLSVCSKCSNNLCPDCFNGKSVCIHCQKSIKKNKIYPTTEIRNEEKIMYNNRSILSKIICCMKW